VRKIVAKKKSGAGWDKTKLPKPLSEIPAVGWEPGTPNRPSLNKNKDVVTLGFAPTPEVEPLHIPPEIMASAIRIVAMGDRFATAAKLVGYHPYTLEKFIRKDKALSKDLDAAIKRGSGRIATLCRRAIITGLKKGRPYFFKAAVLNYEVMLREPDFEAKKLLLELEGVTSEQVESLVSGIIEDLHNAAATPEARAAFTKCSVLQDTLEKIRARKETLVKAGVK
jgi:hypothetical protein